MAENLEAQGFTVESARKIAGEIPIAVAPITLKPRFNPHATSAESWLSPDELPAEVDVRQMSLFGAAWTAGSIKYLAEAGVNTATYYETSGWLGVMELENGPRVPEKFRSIPGSVFPLYHVLADIGEFSGGAIVRSASSAPLSVTGLMLRKDNRNRLLLANLGPEDTLTHVINSGLGTQVRVKYLDETNVVTAMKSPELFRKEAGVLQSADDNQIEIHLRSPRDRRVDSLR